MLEGFTSKGLRVIAFATKEISANHLTMKRDEIEHNLKFLGFLVLENKLKSDTDSVILRLLDAKIACKVISGDNILTTV